MALTLMQRTQKSIDAIAEQSDSVILFCSLGKDSLVLLDLIAPKFRRIVCVFMYFVQGLDHIDRYARWVRARYTNVEWVEMPHWNLTHTFLAGMFCTPRPKQRLMKLADVVKVMKEKYGVYYAFLGMKKADSMNRRLMLKGYEANLYENKGLVYPLADWTQKDILAYMKLKNLPMPVRYSKNASGGVGFNLECYLWMRENAPKDLERVLQAFPMSERILFEYDNKKNQ